MNALSAIRKPLHEVKVSLLFAQYRAFKRGRTVTYQGRTYDYFYARYNLTVRNERAIELPIFWTAVQQYPSERVLELGNVLAHYFPVHHDVVDKYEVAPGVKNVDVVDYQPHRTYDLIVAISTLEHVGWDEQPQDPPKLGRAIAHLRTLLAPGGTLMISMPMGHNPEVDRLVGEGALPLSTASYLKRVTSDNIWREVSRDEIVGAPYNYRIPTANGIVIGTIAPAAAG